PRVRHSFWSLIVGGMVTWTSTYGCNQASVQRFSSLPTLSGARKAVLLNVLGHVLLISIACLAGIVVFAYYVQEGCDPLTSNRVDNPNQIIPYFVMEVLSTPGLPGLFISCLFSGALSSMSSSLNALSAVTWEDFLKPVLGHRLTELQKTWVAKLLVLIYGGLGTGVAFMVMRLGGTVLQASLSFTGAATGPALGMFLLGGVFPWANAAGAVVGGIVGLIFPLWISVGAYSLPTASLSLPFPTNGCLADNATMSTMTTEAVTLTTLPATSVTETGLSGIDQLYTISYLWYGSIGTGTVVVVGLIVSVITGPMKMDDIDPVYLIPIFDRLFCCLPASWRKTLRCHKDFPRPEDIKEADALSMELVIHTSDTSHTNVTTTDVKGSVTSVDSGQGSHSDADSDVKEISTETSIEMTKM
ncbi:hypothetical protein BaRGS_00036772, partial [Batillaria attramentaria]